MTTASASVVPLNRGVLTRDEAEKHLAFLVGESDRLRGEGLLKMAAAREREADALRAKIAEYDLRADNDEEPESIKHNRNSPEYATTGAAPDMLADTRGVVQGEQLAPHWRTVEQHGPWFTEVPPPRSWLLRVPANRETGADERGLLPLGEVGMLVAGGGTGKSTVLAQFAVALALGRNWLASYTGEGGFLTPDGGGRVLLAMAEENRDEMHRKLYRAAEIMQCTPEERALAAQRIVVLPLAGEPVSLVTGAGGKFGRDEIRPSPLAAELQARLDTPGEPWALVVLDPLSRFAGLDTETDNAAATRFIQVLETLTRAPGTPTVLVAHHTNKISRQAGAVRDGSSARGSSALIDGVRWVAELASEPMPEEAVPGTPRTAMFSVTKSNYAALLDEPVRLVRGEHGGLTAVSVQQQRERAAAKAERDAARADHKAKGRSRTRFEEVIAVLKKYPNGIGRNAIEQLIPGISVNTVRGILEALVLEGKVRAPVKQKEGYTWVL